MKLVGVVLAIAMTVGCGGTARPAKGKISATAPTLGVTPDCLKLVGWEKGGSCTEIGQGLAECDKGVFRVLCEKVIKP